MRSQFALSGLLLTSIVAACPRSPIDATTEFAGADAAVGAPDTFIAVPIQPDAAVVPASTGGTGGSGEATGGVGGISATSPGGEDSPDASFPSGGSAGPGGGTGGGGAGGNGGQTSSGGSGRVSTAGVRSVSGGTTGSGGATPAGGTTGSGGATPAGGTTGSGGATRTGGTTVSGGATLTGGATGTPIGPCDIYAADGGPCVAAHSTVRALLGAYNGPLYQVRRTADGTTKDIGVLAPGGLANSADQDAFCGSDACTISVIYDQSGQGNHLTNAPSGAAKRTVGREADAKFLPITIAGKKVYGERNTPGVGYRNNEAKGTATGDNPETIYMIASGDYYNGGCCFDYGNAETNSMDNGEGAVEAVYFGACSIWNKGAGGGPWVMADLENGLWAGDVSPYENNTPVTFKYVTAMVKGDKAGSNHWTIKVGNAQSGSLTTPFDGLRPNSRYNPMRKEGAILLGTAGDNSNAGQGNFFEGLMTAHYSSDAADDAVQANIVAAGYGQ